MPVDDDVAESYDQLSMKSGETAHNDPLARLPASNQLRYDRSCSVNSAHCVVVATSVDRTDRYLIAT